MREKILTLIEQAKETIKNCKTLNDLNVLKAKFIGKNGELTSFLRGMKDLPAEERPNAGKYVNEARDIINKLTEDRVTELSYQEIQAKMEKESIDITLSTGENVGGLHPCTMVKNELIEIFLGLGFKVAEGPEIELDFFNFQALNIPKDHPARAMQDTFYINDDVLLRTHTSPVQVHTMTTEKPPIRIIAPGKVYRPDYDATHSPMFQQIEGLVIDKNITMCDLKGILEEFAKELFDKNTKTRLRPSYFPFTEPSVEVDVTCSQCHGKGCRICKGTGWIEVLGAGIVNPKVLENCGIDPNEYSGFAFGMGIERITMIKYGIPDMRLMFENDARFLKRFK